MAINALAVKTQLNTLSSEAVSLLDELDIGAKLDTHARMTSVINRLAAIHKQIESAREGVDHRGNMMGKGLRPDQRYGLQQSVQAKGKTLSELAQASKQLHNNIVKAYGRLKSRPDSQGAKPVDLWNDLITEGEDFITKIKDAEQKINRLLNAHQTQNQTTIDHAEIARIRQDTNYLRTHAQDPASAILQLTIVFLRLATFLNIRKK